MEPGNGDARDQREFGEQEKFPVCYFSCPHLRQAPRLLNRIRRGDTRQCPSPPVLHVLPDALVRGTLLIKPGRFGNRVGECFFGNAKVITTEMVADTNIDLIDATLTVDGRTFYIIDERMSATKGQQVCESLNMDLAKVTTAAQNLALSDYWVKTG